MVTVDAWIQRLVSEAHNVQNPVYLVRYKPPHFSDSHRFLEWLTMFNFVLPGSFMSHIVVNNPFSSPVIIILKRRRFCHAISQLEMRSIKFFVLNREAFTPIQISSNDLKRSHEICRVSLRCPVSRDRDYFNDDKSETVWSS